MENTTISTGCKKSHFLKKDKEHFIDLASKAFLKASGIPLIIDISEKHDNVSIKVTAPSIHLSAAKAVIYGVLDAINLKPYTKFNAFETTPC